MQQEVISFQDTGYFSRLVCDYLSEDSGLQQFYNRFPIIDNFKVQIADKSASFQLESREVLVDALKNQYRNTDASESTLEHINLLKEPNTFTITTGHQLNLFTGPLYFLYKIISAIKLSKALKETYPDYNFVPIYWMATEDHDFDEINYFNFNRKKIQWNRAAGGAVGEMSNDGLELVYNLFSEELGTSRNAERLKLLFKNAYLRHDNLADATRYLANALFAGHGLVIIDANSPELKKQFIPFIKEELQNQTAFKSVSETNEELSKTYGIQVNPREINLFYLKENLRERLISDDDVYKVNNTDISFTEEALLKEVDTHPERFSPNVIMRPLYQEVILPNLCYIGGGGELAYWFQLKSYFDKVEVPFPVLLLRNSALIKSESQTKKLTKLKVSINDLFLKRDAFINKKVRSISNINIDFTDQRNHLKTQFESFYKLAEQTDKSFLGAVKAQEVKQLKGINNLEKRLLKAQKKKLADQVSRMVEIQNELFPYQSLQERQANFSEFYLEYGESLIPELIEALDPLQGTFSVLTL